MSWIVSASRAGARIFDKQLDKISLIATIPYENGRLKSSDIDSDKAGLSFNRAGHARHAMASEESAHEHAAKDFARILAARLRLSRIKGDFERLVLVAEPHFLGILRAELDSVTAKHLIATVPKDLEAVPPQELSAHLPDLS